MPQLQRRAAAITDGPIDWGTGEILAFGSLLMDGRPVRLAGQDSRRGTFVSRFATIIDRRNADEWTPLANLTEDQAKFYVYDSLLSEYAALGFEYGYSVARPEALVLWEAQFGDFVNGAQTVIDEFITSGETKWRQQSGVVLLLPHGYEGQGPDHSSARIERFLTMAADEAFVVAQPSHARVVLPPAAAALARRGAPAADRLHAEVDAQAQGGRLAARTTSPTARSGRSSATPTADAGPGRHAAALLGPGHLGPDGRAGQARGRRAGSRSRGSSSSTRARRTRSARRSPATRNLKAVRWVQDEPPNMGPWPHYQLNVWPHVDAQVEPIARPESSSPVGRHGQAAHRGAEGPDAGVR